MIQSEDNIDTPILLCAFNEDWTKKSGVNSYKDNIERAIAIIEKLAL